MTYGDLDQGSNRLAHLLLELGVTGGDRVGLYMEKSLEAVTAIYGVLKAGAAYVPVDPAAPLTRVAEVLRDAGVECVLSGREKSTQWAALLALTPAVRQIIVLNCDSSSVDGAPPPAELVDRSRLRDQSAEPVQTSAMSGDLAYILYTSGSTGRQKGVALTHGNAMTFVNWAMDTFELRRSDRLSSAAPFHFDLSIFDLFAAASAGAALVLIPPTALVLPRELRGFLQQSRVSVWYSVPSVLSALVLRGGLTSGDLPELQTVLFAGEVFPKQHLRRLLDLLPHARFANLYGPTETNVCTWYEIPHDLDDGPEPISIGRPIDGVRTFVLREDGGLAGAGEVGELCVQGPTLMEGYWGQPEMTARALVSDPTLTGSGGSAYRTGDLVRQGEDGNYRFLGRRDDQVKVRGYRVELGDVEATLNDHPAVAECAALAVPDGVASNRLIVYLVPSGELDKDELERWCAERLPKPMVPEELRILTRLPRTSTGKIDRQALTFSTRAAVQ
jgi:amino acid adenylation domain-containing protein